MVIGKSAKHPKLRGYRVHTVVNALVLNMLRRINDAITTVVIFSFLFPIFAPLWKVQKSQISFFNKNFGVDKDIYYIYRHKNI